MNTPTTLYGLMIGDLPAGWAPVMLGIDTGTGQIIQEATVPVAYQDNSYRSAGGANLGPDNRIYIPLHSGQFDTPKPLWYSVDANTLSNWSQSAFSVLTIPDFGIQAHSVFYTMWGLAASDKGVYIFLEQHVVDLSFSNFYNMAVVLESNGSLELVATFDDFPNYLAINPNYSDNETSGLEGGVWTGKALYGHTESEYIWKFDIASNQLIQAVNINDAGTTDYDLEGPAVSTAGDIYSYGYSPRTLQNYCLAKNSQVVTTWEQTSNPSDPTFFGVMDLNSYDKGGVLYEPTYYFSGFPFVAAYNIETAALNLKWADLTSWALANGGFADINAMYRTDLYLATYSPPITVVPPLRFRQRDDGLGRDTGNAHINTIGLTKNANSGQANTPRIGSNGLAEGGQLYF